MVSWIAANASLRYFFPIAFDLLKLALADQDIQLRVGETQDELGHLPELLILPLADIGSIAFGKSIHEKRPLSFAEQDDRSIALGLSLPRPGNSLLDHAPAQVGIHLPALDSPNGFAKCVIGDFLNTRKTNKPGVFEDPHETLVKISHLV